MKATGVITGHLLQRELESAVRSLQSVYDYLMKPEMWTQLIFLVVKILIIIIAGRIIIKVAGKMIDHTMVERERNPLRLDRRRTRTIGKLVENIIAYVVNFVSILMILYLFGFNLAPLLAGAGVLGLAIGFGAQSLVKDVITGFFIIFEDQFAVGDVIQTGTYKGTVEGIGLRVTTLRTWTGEVHIIPNGQIMTVTNYSINNSLAVVDLLLTYDADLDKTMTELKEILHQVHESNDNIVKEPEVQGIQSLGEANLTLRITAECRPNTQGAVTRQLNAEIKKRLRDPKVETPYLKGVNYSPGEKG